MSNFLWNHITWTLTQEITLSIKVTSKVKIFQMIIKRHKFFQRWNYSVCSNGINTSKQWKICYKILFSVLYKRKFLILLLWEKYKNIKIYHTIITWIITWIYCINYVDYTCEYFNTFMLNFCNKKIIKNRQVSRLIFIKINVYAYFPHTIMNKNEGFCAPCARYILTGIRWLIFLAVRSDN